MSFHLNALAVAQVKEVIRLAEIKAAKAAKGIVPNLHIHEWQEMLDLIDSLAFAPL